jgi:hypothetical protein
MPDDLELDQRMDDVAKHLEGDLSRFTFSVYVRAKTEEDAKNKILARIPLADVFTEQMIIGPITSMHFNPNKSLDKKVHTFGLDLFEEDCESIVENLWVIK